MGSFRAKGYFEFTLSDVSKLTGEVYSPPFATSDDMFWQLKFVASFKEDPEYFSLFLCAIPNADEEHLEGVWTRRGTLTATLYLKHFALLKADSPPVSQHLRTFPIGMDNFCAKWAGYGLNRFYKKSLLPTEFTLGVEFDKTMFRPLAQAGPLPGKPLADELAGAWTEVLNKQEMADVRFNVQGHTIYACSTILSKRSVYFSKMFQQKWGEAQKRQMKPEQTSTYNQQPGSPTSPKHFDKTTSPGKAPSESAVLSSQIKYVIEVPDFHHATFLEMLRYLYTDKVTFDKREDSHRTALDMFDIADKYLIADLRQKSKAKICRDINDNNAAELLFGFAWRYPDLKEFTMRHVVDNFQRVRKSTGYKTIVANPGPYPRASELNFELIQMLLPEEESPKP